MIRGCCVGLIVALAAVSSAQADELAEQGRALLAKHQDAVVTISVVIKQQFSAGGMSQDDESKMEVTGTVIDESGLTVCALSETDPSGLMQRLMGSMMQDMNISSEVTEAKILMRDGSEVPVRVVLRDKDLDLAFLRPTEPLDEPMAFVDTSAPAEVDLLDQLFVLNRLGKVAARSYAVAIERIECVVERPRRFYIPGKDPTNSGLGCPAFDTDGNLVGFMVLRSMATGGGGGMMSMLGGMQDGIAPIILPASDVTEIAAQAPSVDEVPDESAESAEGEEEAPAEDDAA